jgi:SAM-dependent methyltransferase
MGKYLLAEGWDVTAQELSPTFVEELSKIENIKLETRNLLEICEKKKYSLIYADSVIEHVADPLVYFNKMSSLLEPGGILYTVQPNEYSLLNFCLNVRSRINRTTPSYISPYKDAYHLIGFTKKSLQICGEKSGLRLISFKKENDYSAFQMRLSKKRSPLIRYPAAGMLALAQLAGYGTITEAMFLKE